jgi:hypothetical protein
LLSQDNLQKKEACDSLAIKENASPTSHAVFLPIAVGPQRCGPEVKLSTGPFRLCATLLQQSADQLSIEYEEESNYDREIRISRVRFDILLQRNHAVPLGHIWGCTLRVSAAFSFDPKQPGKLAPYLNVGHERCEINHAMYNGVPGEQPPPQSPEDRAILDAAERKTTVCVPRVGGGYVASVYDSELTGSGDAIVETASVDDKGQLRFMNSKVYPGEIAWTSSSKPGARSETEDNFKAGKFERDSPDIWARTFKNGARAFFGTCHF